MWQYLIPIFLNILVPILVLVSTAAIAVILVARVTIKPKTSGWQALVYAFSFLGGLIGIYVGASKTPVIGTILPAILTFVTALLAYLFSRENLSEMRPVIPFCLIALMLTTAYASFVGTSMKREWIVYEKEYKEWLLHYEKVALEVAKAKYLKDLKENKLSEEDFEELMDTNTE